MKHDSVVLKGGDIVVLIPDTNVLKIFEEDAVDEGAYCPPKLVRLVGRENLLKLRDMLNKAYPPESEATE